MTSLFIPCSKDIYTCNAKRDHENLQDSWNESGIPFRVKEGLSKD
jgi:hypothetical protein